MLVFLNKYYYQSINDCKICKKPHLPVNVFEEAMFLPVPIPQDDGHCKSFEDVYGTKTTEEHRPSHQKKPVKQNFAILSQRAARM